ncbi:MAG: hypothetical protein ACLGHC_08710 [Alphaproteobacteria bacterium]
MTCLASGAAFSSYAALYAQSSDSWLLSESGATGDADVKLDMAAARRALPADSPDAQRRMNKAMTELLRAYPGKNRLFDAATAPGGAVDVTAEFTSLLGDRQEAPREAELQASSPSQSSSPVQAEAQPQIDRPIVVTATRSEPLVAPQQMTESESVPLVTLTFPATITPRAEARLKQAFDKLKWPVGCGGFMSYCSENDHFLDQIVAKSAYFVPDVYAALAKQLPKNSVVIQAATLDVDSAGRFSYRLPNDDLPSAIRLDFIVFVAPRYYASTPSTVYTHGLYVLPAFVASTQPKVRKSNSELFAISRRISPTGVGPNPSALVQLATTAEQKRSDAPKGVISFGDKQLKISDAEWKHVESPLQSREFVTGLMAKELKPFIAAVKAIDRRLVERTQIARYASLYSGVIEDAGPAGWELLPKFISAEREFTNEDTLAALSNLREGEFGESFRQMIRAEREQNKKAGRAMWAGALTAMAGGFSAAAAGTSAGPQMLVATMQQNMAIAQANNAFSASVGGVASGQRSVVISFGERQITVHARSIPEFREKFRALLMRRAANSDATVSSFRDSNNRRQK